MELCLHFPVYENRCRIRNLTRGTLAVAGCFWTISRFDDEAVVVAESLNFVNHSASLHRFSCDALLVVSREEILQASAIQVLSVCGATTKTFGLTVAATVEEEIVVKQRGRPRSYMGEFDLSLINEFRSRPAFYDRNHPRFRDKVFTAREWQEISNKLGYDVSLLKDRMLQLRNRYNLEKRRLEQLREEEPGKLFESPWPLYEQLHFLSDHIRARRSYKRMVTVHQSPGDSFDYNSPGYITDCVPCHAAAPFANGLLAVKMEANDEEDQDQESDNADSGNRSDPDLQHAKTPFPPPMPIYQNNQHSLQHDKDNSSLPKISVRRLATDEDANNKVARKRVALTKLAASAYRLRRLEPKEVAPPRPSKQAASKAFTARDQKYMAFGEFISSALLDLPQEEAMKLIEKFTCDIVRQHTTTGSSAFAADGAAVDFSINGNDAAIGTAWSNSTTNGQ